MAAPSLKAALAAIWGDVPTQRCTAHKHRNLLANAPARLHDEITADYNDIIFADTPQKRRKDFLRKWRLRHPAVANSLEEAGDHLLTFTTLPPSQWKSERTTNAIERLHEELKRAHQHADHAAMRRNCRHAVLGAASVRLDHHAENRRLEDARAKIVRSAR
jgi:transposase-like protein